VIGRYVLRLPGLMNRQTEDLVAEVGPTVQRYVDGRT
jgi:Tetracyclin repressor-like, C-terminal domain